MVLTWMLRGGRTQWILDHPNHRSLHTSPVPRIGGLAMMAGVMVSWLWVGSLHLVIGTLLLVLLSLADDLVGLSARWRFCGHFVVAAAWIGWLSLPVPFFLATVLVLAVVWMTNLYNFMDGSDGLAGGMALFGFGTYAFASGLSGHMEFAMLNLTVAATALVFLGFNFHPARIFMGDAGSIPLGFLSAVLGLLGWQRSIWPWWFPILVFSPFIVDATVTLFKRLLRKEPFWQAHRSHYYQRLVQMGWGHKKTALVEYGLMIACGGCAVLSLHETLMAQLLVLTLWLAAYLILMMAVDNMWRKHTQIERQISSL